MFHTQVFKKQKTIDSMTFHNSIESTSVKYLLIMETVKTKQEDINFILFN